VKNIVVMVTMGVSTNLNYELNTVPDLPIGQGV